MIDWPLPKDISTLRGFLGFTSYYSRFVKGYDLIAKPPTSMLKKDNFEWTVEARGAFEELKMAMTKTLVLALPNFKKPFKGILMIAMMALGQCWCRTKRPLAFISKVLGPMKRSWSTYA